MSLEIAQYPTIAQDMFGKVGAILWGPPFSVDTLENGETITIGGTEGARLVRILAIATDQKLVWQNGTVETFKEGVPELRISRGSSEPLTCMTA